MKVRIANNKNIVTLNEIKNFSKDNLSGFIDYLLSLGGNSYNSNTVQKMFNEDPDIYFYISSINVY